jgi:hypothetical protein
MNANHTVRIVEAMAVNCRRLVSHKGEFIGLQLLCGVPGGQTILHLRFGPDRAMRAERRWERHTPCCTQYQRREYANAMLIPITTLLCRKVRLRSWHQLSNTAL